MKTVFRIYSCLPLGAMWLAAPGARAAWPPAGTIIDEAQVPQYVLPPLLVCADGTTVSDAQTWEAKRRPELLRLFETHVYGRSPGRPDKMRFVTVSNDANALDGLASRRQITVLFDGRADGPKMDLLLYLPNAARKPVPAFLSLGFKGNHTVHSDPGIALARDWTGVDARKGEVSYRAADSPRGSTASRWPVETILKRGFALGTIFYGDIEPDFADGWKLGVRGALSKDGAKSQFAPDAWGAIGAWAWGLSRALDYLETDGDIDARRVAVVGHSRLGKTALWAGAQDTRFALVISNDSGCGGAALSRRCFGETVKRINTSFPHWFCANFKRYNDNESALPIDQHELIALIAPRPVYVASAEKDLWADPRGEFLSALNAEPVWRMYGLPGLGAGEMPPIDRPVAGGTIGYHIRTGKHDITAYDWDQYLAFAERRLR